MSRLDRVTSDPGDCHGQPIARGQRRDDLLAASEFGVVGSGRGRTAPLGTA